MTTHCNHRTDSQGHYCAECRARWDRAIIVAALRATHERSGVQIARPTDSELLGVLNAAIVALKSRDQNSFEMKVLDGLKVAMAQLEASSSLSSAEEK